MNTAFFCNYSWLILGKQIIKATFSIWKNYPKIILLRQVDDSIGYKAMLQYISFDKALSTICLLNAALYKCVDIEIVIGFFAFVEDKPNLTSYSLSRA